MKFIILLVFFISPAVAPASGLIPKVKIEYSYALDMYCPAHVEPEMLSPAQVALISNIPIYRTELLSKLGWLQGQWDQQGIPLMTSAVQIIGKSFLMNDLQAAVFLCPRFPFMGTPLAFNIISYLDSSAKDIPGLGQPLPVFFFISTAFHEVLHKYINDILEKNPSAVLSNLNATDLYKAHLHLFALQKAVFESLQLAYLLPHIEKLEATHGPDYVSAWKAVHENPALYTELINELKK